MGVAPGRFVRQTHLSWSCTPGAVDVHRESSRPTFWQESYLPSPKNNGLMKFQLKRDQVDLRPATKETRRPS